MNIDRAIGGVLQGCAIIAIVLFAIQTAVIWFLIDWILSR
jgi:hypothetical protein